MPAIQRGQAYRISANRWGVRYYDESGVRRRKSPFSSKSAALKHYREVIEPRLRGDAPATRTFTLAEFVPVYLERHAAEVRGRTIAILRERLAYAQRAYGEVALGDLERMSGDLASWFATLPTGSRYGIAQALRQALEAAVRWGYMQRNPAKLAGRNRQPPPRAIRVFTLAELEAIAKELSPMYRALPIFAAATGLRPEEWIPLERRDLDRQTDRPLRSVSGARQARTSTAARSSSTLPRQTSADARSRCQSVRLRRSTRSHRDWTPLACFLGHEAGCSTSMSSAGASGSPRWRPPAFASRRASTTCARPSRAARSQLACPFSSWRG